MMKRLVLFGAGQVGAAAARLAGPEFELLCFADNNSDKWGQKYEGVPVCSPQQALCAEPDCICLCAMGDGRRAQMTEQLRVLGFAGELISTEALRLFDVRAAEMRLLAGQINKLSVPGDIAELGVFRGDFARLISAAFPTRTIHLFDTFEGFAREDAEHDAAMGYSKAKTGDFSDTSQEYVASRLPCAERAIFHKGFFPDTFKGCEKLRFAFVSIDADLYAPTAAALPLFWDRLSPGGAIMIHDAISTQFTGVMAAVDDFCADRRLLPTPLCDLHGSVILRKELK